MLNNLRLACLVISKHCVWYVHCPIVVGCWWRLKISFQVQWSQPLVDASTSNDLEWKAMRPSSYHHPSISEQRQQQPHHPLRWKHSMHWITSSEHPNFGAKIQTAFLLLLKVHLVFLSCIYFICTSIQDEKGDPICLHSVVASSDLYVRSWPFSYFFRPYSSSDEVTTTFLTEKERHAKNLVDSFSSVGHYQDVQDSSQLNDMSFSGDDLTEGRSTSTQTVAREPQMDSK